MLWNLWHVEDNLFFIFFNVIIIKCCNFFFSYFLIILKQKILLLLLQLQGALLMNTWQIRAEPTMLLEATTLQQRTSLVLHVHTYIHIHTYTYMYVHSHRQLYNIYNTYVYKYECTIRIRIDSISSGIDRLNFINLKSNRFQLYVQLKNICMYVQRYVLYIHMYVHTLKKYDWWLLM